MRARLAITSALLCACADRSLVLADPDLNLSVYVFADSAGVLDASILARGRGSVVSRELPADTAWVSIAKLDVAALSEVEGLDPDRIGEVDVVQAAPPRMALDPERVNGAVFQRAPIPLATHFVSARADDEAFGPDAAIEDELRSRLTLLVPSRGDLCANHGPTLSTFAVVPLRVAVSQDLVRFDDDHILLIDDARLVVATRDGAITPLLDLSTQPGVEPASARIDALTRDPRPARDGVFDLWLSFCYVPDTGPPDPLAALFHVRTSTGTVLDVETATVVPDAYCYARLALDERGHVLFGLSATRFIGGDVEPLSLRSLPPPPDPSGTLASSLAATADPVHPFILGLRDAVYTLRWATSTWQLFRFSEDADDVPTVTSRVGAGGELEIWAGGNEGLMHDKPAGSDRFSVTPITLPVGARACSVDDERLIRGYGRIAFAGDELIATLTECSVGLRVRNADLCSSVLSEPGVEPILAEATELIGLNGDAGWITLRRAVGAGSTVLLEMRQP